MAVKSGAERATAEAAERYDVTRARFGVVLLKVEGGFTQGNVGINGEHDTAAEVSDNERCGLLVFGPGGARRSAHGHADNLKQFIAFRLEIVEGKRGEERGMNGSERGTARIHVGGLYVTDAQERPNALRVYEGYVNTESAESGGVYGRAEGQRLCEDVSTSNEGRSVEAEGGAAIKISSASVSVKGDTAIESVNEGNEIRGEGDGESVLSSHNFVMGVKVDN